MQADLGVSSEPVNMHTSDTAAAADLVQFVLHAATTTMSSP